jgi:hypothetical protein
MKYVTTLAIAALFTGCASVSNYKPTINEKADKNYTNAQSDLEYCGGLASKTAGYTTNGIEDALVAGSGAAAIGAVSGAVIAGTVSAGTGAVAGAGIGSIVGLYYGLYEADETFKRAYNSCMSQLGHPVIW